MAVGASCAGSLRWRALGRATHLLCPLHRLQLAGGSPAPSRPRLAPSNRLPRHHPIRCALAAATPAVTHHAAAALLASTTAAAPPAAAAAAAAAAGLPPALVSLISLLPSLGTFILCLAAAVLLLASVPAVWALARAAHRAERLMAVVEAELPDTAASMRLAGLEMSDCVQELGALGGELTRGVRSAAALATTAETGVRGGVAAADAALRNHVVPAVAKAERGARGAVEGHLVETAKLSYTRPLVLQAASAAATAARRLRTGLAVGQLAGAAVQAGRNAADALSRHQQQQQRQQREELHSKLEAQLLQRDEQALREKLQALRERYQRQSQQPANQQPPQRQ
ncbi:hypothetical protein PLESTB_001801700 [Pleodorina starrii]|uniref:Uncharacterized protein n=1 Tax=Pleodorina starrii TaxID=330485 RepID=A0A9W6C284_9CHLO|nr:hypothetical protein PLESTM_001927800 [Pleodorina starrii]GLC61776.1 hypothetical protein PLESTB_001801700 [Pleodorina starrii]